MPVVEYMLHKEGHRRLVPEFIGDRGHWYNPTDHTYVGWVEENPDHYVPDSIVSLTKEQFITRQLEIHNIHPMRKSTGESAFADGEIMSTEEVTLVASTWYDEFVSKNSVE